jgi:hypothetical protein
MPNSILKEKEKENNQVAFKYRHYELTEVNLQKWPFFLLSRKGGRNRPGIYYEKILGKNESLIKITWQVTANSKYGHPGPFDKKVKAVIDQIICENGFPVTNPIPFSLYDICKRLDIDINGRNKRNIKTALKRIAASFIESKGTFYDKETEKRRDAGFHLFDVFFLGERRPDTGEEAEKNYIFLSDIYRASWNSYYVKPLDFKYFLSLESDIARRLYELLSLKFYGIFEHHQNIISMEYKEVTDLLPIEKQIFFSLAKSKLEKAHKELINTQFLENVEWTQLRDIFIIHYQPGQKAKEEYYERVKFFSRQIELPFEGDNGKLEKKNLLNKVKEEIVEKVKSEKSTEDSSLIEELANLLVVEGFSMQTGKELVNKYYKENIIFRNQNYNLIKFEIEHYKWAKIVLYGEKKPRGPQWLLKAIEEKWLPSEDSFKTEIEKKEETEKIIKQEQRQKEEEQHRIEEDGRKKYFKWLKMSPRQRWNEFEFRYTFNRKNGRDPTHEEIREGFSKYLEHPETPEEYQKRIFGNVKYPVSLAQTDV